jgi:hypothetical protein
MPFGTYDHTSTTPLAQKIIISWVQNSSCFINSYYYCYHFWLITTCLVVKGNQHLPLYLCLVIFVVPSWDIFLIRYFFVCSSEQTPLCFRFVVCQYLQNLYLGKCLSSAFPSVRLLIGLVGTTIYTINNNSHSEVCPSVRGLCKKWKSMESQKVPAPTL